MVKFDNKVFKNILLLNNIDMYNEAAVRLDGPSYNKNLLKLCTKNTLLLTEAKSFTAQKQSMNPLEGSKKAWKKLINRKHQTYLSYKMSGRTTVSKVVIYLYTD